MILIVDADETRCAALFNMVKWSDNRLKVLTAKAPTEVWALIKLKKPLLLICGDNISDVPQFLESARKAMPSTMLVLCGAADLQSKFVGFDGYLQTPPTRLSILTCMHSLKKRRTKLKEDSRPQKRVNHFNSNGNMFVTVGMDDEGLTFKVPARQEMCVKDLIHQLGKPTIKCRRLLRGGADVSVSAETKLQEGDFLYFN